MLCELPVLGRGAATEVVEGQIEASIDVGLDLMLLTAELRHLESCRQRRQLGRRSVLISGTDVEDLVPSLTLESRIDVRRQHGSDKVAEMLDAVDIGKGAGYQNP